MVTKTPILAHYKSAVKTIVETNSSNDISSGVLFQLDDNKLLHLVAFSFMNLDSSKYNYEIYDKELLAIIRYFE